jgi:hypothetical protein
MGCHGQRVHAGIGATCAMHRNLLAGDRVDRLFHGLLNRGAVRLPLPAHEGPPVILDREAEAGHSSFAPTGI